jgi:hypothetical protein
MNSIAQTLEKLQKQLSEALQTAATSIQTEADRVDALANENAGGTILTLTRCELPQEIARGVSIDHISGLPGRYHYPTWQQNVKRARELVLEARRNIEARHQENLPVIENNKAVAQHVKRIMTNLGIPESRTTYGYATARAKNMTRRTVTSGYVTDLAEVCKTEDGYKACCSQLDSFESRINAYEAEHRKADALAQSVALEQKAARNSLVLLGQLSGKYACEASAPAIIEALCERDKYFALGYWMMRNRTDWNDGPARAQRGLGYFFPLISDEDQAINAEISALCDDWDGDGRVFRDCTYNYDVLFARADDEVLRDFKALEAAGVEDDDPF